MDDRKLLHIHTHPTYIYIYKLYFFAVVVDIYVSHQNIFIFL